MENPESTLQLMEAGNASRATGSTAMNKTSSRSHAIFTIIVEATSRDDTTDVTTSRFHLVDLAGSERIKRTKAEGQRLQEGIKINAGLLALGNVISALGESKPPSHIPYRDSKLTRLLQNSLGGNSMTVMIACASPADSNTEETLNTLRYADRARKIKNKAVVNRNPQSAELARLKQENERLKLQLRANGGSVDSSRPSSVASSSAQSFVTADTHLNNDYKKEVEELTEKNKKISEQYDELISKQYDMLRKMVELETKRDDMRSQIYSIQDSARNVCDDSHDLSIIEEAVAEGGKEEKLDCVKKLRSLQENILKLKVDENDITKEVDTIDLDQTDEDTTMDMSNENGGIADETGKHLNTTEMETQNHAKKHAYINSQLAELSKAIEAKEEMMKQIADSEELKKMKMKYEQHVQQLDEHIGKLEREKQQLTASLEQKAKNSEGKKVNEQRRQQIVALESKIKQLQVEKREKERLLKQKVQSDTKIVKLNGDIQSLKNARAKLAKQLKQENKKHMQWRKDKENQLKQLEKKDRKRQVEYTKEKMDMKRRQRILERKNEQNTAVINRLQDILNKQERNKKMKQANKAQLSNNHQDKKSASSNQHFEECVTEELELRVHVHKARKALCDMESELNRIGKEIKELDGAEMPKQKKRRTFLASDLQDEVGKRRALQLELRKKTNQVEQLKNKLQQGKDAIAHNQNQVANCNDLEQARSIIKCLMNKFFDQTVASEKEIQKLYDDKMSLEENVRRMESKMQNLIAEVDEKNAVITSSHVQLKKSHHELEELKRQAPKKKTPPKPKVKVIYEDSEEYDDEDDVMDQSQDEWVPTPILNKFRRRAVRQSTLLGNNSKLMQKHTCSCKSSGCINKQCSCVKGGRGCGEQCACNKEICKNASTIIEEDEEEGDNDDDKEGNLNETFNVNEHKPHYKPFFFDSPLAQ